MIEKRSREMGKPLHPNEKWVEHQWPGISGLKTIEK
jgi:hypothetical protein